MVPEESIVPKMSLARVITVIVGTAIISTTIASLTFGAEKASEKSMHEGSAERESREKEMAQAMDVLRLYITTQFAQLSVFAALTGGAILFFRQGAPGPDRVTVIMASGFAGLTSLCFWISWESMAMIVSHTIRRIGTLEKTLDHRLMSTMPGMPDYRFSPSKWAQRVLYMAATVGWTTSFIYAILLP